MNIPALGDLQPHSRVPEWLTSTPVAVPYFDGERVAFVLDSLGESDEEDANRAINAFLRLGPSDREAAAPYVFTHYRSIAEALSENDLGCRIDPADQIWRHVHPSEVFVSRRTYGEQAIYIQITAECDWEPEHGLQIIYRGGCELSRVSGQDGHLTHTDAYDLPEEQDRIV